MGYRKKRTVYKLVFEDPDLDGLEVVARSVPLESLLSVQRLISTADSNPEDAEALFRKLAGVLVSWNLETEEGETVPCTFEGLAAQEFPFVMEILNAWQAAMVTVPKASPNGLNGGATSPAPSIPMEVSSPSPPN